MIKSPKIPNYIQECFRTMTKKMTGEAYDCEYGEIYPDSERYYLELHDDGKMAIVAQERGKYCYRRETYSLNELMYWMAELEATAIVISADDTYFANFTRQAYSLELLGRVSPEYRARAERELVNPPPRFTIAERPN